MEPNHQITETESEKTEPTELILEKKIIEGVYLFNQDIFRNKTRFEMVLSQPNPSFQFQVVKDVFKGRFICKNPKCTEDEEKNNKFKKNESESESDDDNQDEGDSKQFKTWMSWHQSQKKKFVPKVKVQHDVQSEKDQENKMEPTQKIETTGLNQVKLQNAVKKQNGVKLQNQPKEEGTNEVKNKKWSSSLSQVFLYYYSCPKPLEELREVYAKLKNQKIEIYFFVELTGQICKKCDNDAYCYPFFGRTELKRIRKNFSNFFYNKIHNKKILKYKPCRLKRLRRHDEKRCEACKRGICGIKALSS